MIAKLIPIVDQRAARHVPVIPAHTHDRLLRDTEVNTSPCRINKQNLT